MTRLLVLGGTTEARTLCGGLAARGIETVVSLAGRVPNAVPYAVPHRVGGFGGADGLARFLETEGFRALIDATHPFAAQMPWHAARAAKQSGLPWLMLKRPPWVAAEDDDWQAHPNLETAIDALPAGARGFLATGAGSLQAVARRSDCALFLRQMTDPGVVLAHVTVLKGRPGDRSAETELLRGLHISHLVTKNSGGPARDKLAAARDLGLRVFMVARPALPEGPVVETAQAALNWCETIA